MTRFWICGFGLVLAISALKTYVIVLITMDGSAVDWSMVSGLFALFLTLTSTVAYIIYTQLHRFLERECKGKLSAGQSEPVAKESVILRNAADWGLSQAEADVAIFVVKGFSNTEIADMRGSAITTVKSQLGRIYNKTGFENRYQLIAFVTDEVCASAHEGGAKIQRSTRKELSIVGRTRSAA